MDTNERNKMKTSYQRQSDRQLDTALMEIKVTYEDGTVEFVPCRAQTIEQARRDAAEVALVIRVTPTDDHATPGAPARSAYREP